MFSSEHNPKSITNPCARGCKSSSECSVWKQLIQTDQVAAEHPKLEQIASDCNACMQQLAGSIDESKELAWWEAARSSWLESDLPESVRSESSLVTVEIQSQSLSDDPIDAQRVSIDFLSPAMHPELLGRIGRYDVERIIGVGGMGVVLKAYDSELHRVVAIKVLAEHLANNSSARRRFAREAQAAAAVVHANVIPIFNVETNGKHPFLVMQCVSGGSLQAKVDAHGPLSVAETLRIVKQTAAGLAAAHQQGLVHRDVKPANILLEENVDRVLLSDFGLARAVDDASFTRTGVVVGTPHYMSPEQANGDSIQCASDQFSLGSVIYFMLTGHPPFRAQTAMGVLNRICHSSHRPLTEINESIPLEVSQLVDRLMSKDPLQRFGSASEVEQEADRLLSALQSGQLRLLSKPDSRPPADSIRRSVMLASLLLAVVGLGVAAWRIRIYDNAPQDSTGNVGLDRWTGGDTAMPKPGAISVREYEAAKEQYRSWMEIDFVFQRELVSAQQVANGMEQTWEQNSTHYPAQSESFDSQLEELKSQIQSTQTQWLER